MNRIRLVIMAFAALVAASATAVTVAVDDSCVGMGSVSWKQTAVDGGTATLTLAAEAADGCAFSGWTVGGKDPEWDFDLRNPSVSNVVVPTNASVTAMFVAAWEDTLYFDFADDLSDLECGKAVDVQLFVDSASYPTLKFSGLPAGLYYDARTLSIRGTPTTPCSKTLVVTGSNGSGYKFSQTFDTSVSDISGERLVGQDVELALGEYYHASFEEVFTCYAERVSTKLTGFPPGLEWRDSWDLLFGTPSASGTFVLQATVKFPDGTSETATARMVVVAPSPSDYDVDLSGIEDLAVGDSLISGECEIGRYEDGIGIVSVKGLPRGLSVETWTDDSAKVYGIVGLVREPGRFSIHVVVKAMDGDDVKTIDTESVVFVSDSPGRYLKVSVDADSPDGSGSVSGGGVVSAASGATIKATAAKGNVFAGWFDADGEIAEMDDGVDYRSPSVSFGPDAEFEFMDLKGRFVPQSEDDTVEFEGLSDETFSFAADDSLAESFTVSSLSLPVLSATGLPTGVSIVPGEDGEYRLVYDGETVARRPSPGRYAVTITAVNQSKAKATATFLLVVENVYSDRIAVEDDYGEFVPDEAIEPIDLSGAVDFASGETLSVSGLPRGLVWNASENAKTGAAAHTITGIPTQPGYYTLTFTAKVVSSVTTNGQGRVVSTFETATATAFLTILPYPELSIEVDDDAAAAGCKVSGGGHYKVGTKATLKATAAKGWVFAGWDGVGETVPFASLAPTLSIETGQDDLYVGALFVQVEDDSLELLEPYDTENGFAAELELGVDVEETEYAYLVADLVDTVSLPVVSVSGLPAGIKFNAKTFALFGKPTKSGVYYATVTAKNAGGYSFVRVLRIAVLDADGELPQEAGLQNDAGIDFSPLDTLTTGVLCQEGDVVLEVGARPEVGTAVKKVSVSGVPSGLKAATVVVEGLGSIELTGTPSKPGRLTMVVTVTYEDGKTAKSQYAFNVEDGGSYYLSVLSVDDEMGTASGSGVYPSGATVKISAKAAKKCVFAGWLDDVDGYLFEPMAETDGIDCRTATASFPFRPDDFPSRCAVYADFALSEDDGQPFEIAFEDGVWEIDPEAPSHFWFYVGSLSLPKLTVKNLPKGVTVDLARGYFSYVPSASVQPGIYSVSVTAQNQSKAKATDTFEIHVANRESDMISGLDPSMDAYPLSVGVALDPSILVPEIADGASLSVKGLPAGLSFKNGIVSGVPTKAGDYTVTFTAVEGTGKAKKTGVATITLRIDSLPSVLVGTFNGFVYDDSGDPDRAVGIVTATASAAGKISVSIKTQSGTERFSTSGWSQFDEMGVAAGEMSTTKGSSISVAIDSTVGWREWQLSGTYNCTDGEFRIQAQRNAFDAKTGEADARGVAESLAGTYKNDALAVSVQKAGTVRFSGKHDGHSISGSTVLFFDEYGSFAKYIGFDKVAGITEVYVEFDEDLGTAQWSVIGN